MKLPLHLGVCALALTGFTAPSPSEAALGLLDLPQPLAQTGDDGTFQLARGENSGRGGGNSGRGGGDDDRDDDDRDDDDDDRGRGDDRGGNDSPNDASGSGRDRPRVPGGSGCDDPGDVAEHAECQV
ncbi:MAG: hypothetical protein OEM24_12440 [Paracoccaceae bacterium]|nr:hypothetical protein [Paracoccaceae bacterium]